MAALAAPTCARGGPAGWLAACLVAASLVGCTVLAFFSVSILLVLLRWQGLLPG